MGETEEAVSRFLKSMQCKLKFLQTQGVMDMSERLHKSIPHASLAWASMLMVKLRQSSTLLKEDAIFYRILKNAPELKYEDLVCDLLYQFKYTVTGLSVARETEEAISSFPKSMQCKLKLLQTQGVMEVSERLHKSIFHTSLHQVIHAWQLKILPLAE
ncbi:unnamed protein product [Bursaphelenchus okinawaensis]|uniref:Uncharacterized protein n=1 Tax=Bursaphelenchus okinawaensis TaxID=465554 RepID=A0A811K5D1_9BILA|nr:unnamed protein product [Bursaphelenchus okinawaensis]CAG9091061.1 unnamed protein product [Bursaphelenchus okinawaensis]